MVEKENWHNIKIEEALKNLKSDEAGLSVSEAGKRLQRYGLNELVRAKGFSTLRLIVSQFASFLIIILIVAAIISAIIGNWIDFWVIMAIVAINGTFGFVQEYRAEKAIESLKKMLVPKARVFRDGRVVELDSREIVPGDILVLSEGDKIMADARVLEAGLRTNEAPLTGESAPVDKTPEVVNADKVLAERTNMVYLGTEVVRGNAKALVIATGMKTEYGRIAALVQEVEPEKTPLKEKLDIFARNLAIVILALISVMFIIGVLLGFDIFDMFLTAVTLAVAVIPEGLPAVITIGLALSTQHMLKVKSLIRRLPAAETLGRTTAICSDKTGTITEEKMTVKKIYANRKFKEAFTKDSTTEMLFSIGVLCNNARIEHQGTKKEYLIGDPTEKALILAAKDYGLSKKVLTEQNKRVAEFSFSSARKMMSVVREHRGRTSYVKGAPEVILAKCKAELVNGRVQRLTGKRRTEITKAYETLASQGMRVLGFAYKTLVGEVTQKRAEQNLIFVGFQGMIDPPRPEVKRAIEECNSAGIKVVMITGDSLLTAIEVGKQIGLKGKAIGANQFRKMSDSHLRKEIDDIGIFARISPEDKLRIVNILKTKKEIVAVTGDGVNDAPALKRADIGVAVNRGTDVAKDSSDMIILDNNFASIPKAVGEGRRVYDNIKKFIKFLLSANLGELLIILVALLVGLPLPLLPLQILWINLVTDSFPALALSREEPERNIMRRKPTKGGILADIKGFILLGGFLTFAISFLFFVLTLEDLAKARTMAVSAAVLFEMFLAFNAKTKESVFKSPVNRYLIGAVALSIALHLAVLYTPANFLFQFTPLLLVDWLMIIGACIVGFFIVEGYKKYTQKTNM